MFDKHEPERTELTPELAALERQLSALATASAADRPRQADVRSRPRRGVPATLVDQFSWPALGRITRLARRHRDDDRRVGIAGDDASSAT